MSDPIDPPGAMTVEVELGPVDAAAEAQAAAAAEAEVQAQVDLARSTAPSAAGGVPPQYSRFHVPAAGQRRQSMEARKSLGYAPAPSELPGTRRGPSLDRRTSMQISATSTANLALAADAELARGEARRSMQLGAAPAVPAVKAAPEVVEAAGTDDHKVPLVEILERLGTDAASGLTAQERAERLERYGPNALTPPKPVPWWVRLLAAMFSAFAILLWIAAVAAIVSYVIPLTTGKGEADEGYLALGIVLIIVNLISGTFTYAMEYKAEAIMNSFKNLTPTMANVIVNGSIQEINAVDLVPGDIVVINGGEKVPADVRILDVAGLKVDMCSFTGETEALPRTVEATDDIALHSRNLAFFGTSATEGTARAVVVRTGDRTELGLIAALASKSNKTEVKDPDLDFDQTDMTEAEIEAERRARRKQRILNSLKFWRKPAIDPDSDQSPMRLEINYFVKIVALIACFFGLLCLILSFVFKPKEWLENILFGIGICVALVPEGLLITVTLSLALTARRMAERKVLVKNMESIETLGCCSVIVSDKTGTLTQNKMTVGGAFAGLRPMDIRPIYNTVEFTGDFDVKDADFSELLRCLTLCSRAEFATEAADADTAAAAAAAAPADGSSEEQRADPNDNYFLRAARGDASECALLRFAAITHDYATERVRWPKLAELPFNSRNKFSASVHGRPIPDTAVEDTECDIRPVLYFKGAPERVLARCSHYMHNGERKQIDDAFRTAFDDSYAGFGGQGMRVLAFAKNDLPAAPYAAPDYEWNFEDEADTSDTHLLHGLTFVGLMALNDPPRDEVPEAVRVCRAAHVRVVMATGDHPLTGQAIAKQIGLVRGTTDVEIAAQKGISVTQVRANLAEHHCKAAVVSGAELSEMSETDLEKLLSETEELVLARMSPVDKLRVVRAFQRLGNIVASLGDGVNDSPHLSQADIGVAMNDGSQVTKDVADLILLDNSFASIVAGVAEGRLLFSNVKKSIAYTLTSNIPELLPFLLQLILQMPLALTTIQILAIDLGTDLAPAISFTYEPAEADIMTQPPRDPHNDSLISGQMIGYVYPQIGLMQAAALFSCFLCTMGMNGQLGNLIGNIKEDFDDPDVLRMAQSAAFFSIIVVQLSDAMICKTRSMSGFTHGWFNNPRMLFSMLFEVILGLFFIFTPGINTALGMAPWDSALYCLPALPWFVFIIFYDEMRKLAIRKWPDGWIARLTYY